MSVAPSLLPRVSAEPVDRGVAAGAKRAFDVGLVGPRALRPDEIHTRGNGKVVRLEHVPGYRERHAVRPGLTGLAQIYADRDVRLPQKFRYDRLYIRRRSLGFDLRLIALSF